MDAYESRRHHCGESAAAAPSSAVEGRPALRESADVVTVRGVRLEGEAFEDLQSLLRVGGALLLFTGVGEADVRGDVRKPLRWRGTYPLVQSLRSRLVVLEKTKE